MWSPHGHTRQNTSSLPPPVYAAAGNPTSHWWNQTFITGPARSVVAFALTDCTDDIIEQLAPMLARTPDVKIQLRTVEDSKMDQIYTLFRHIESRAGDTALVREFQTALWLRAKSARYIMHPGLPALIQADRYRDHQSSSARRAEQELLEASPYSTTWFPETFNPVYPRSVVQFALIDSVGDIVKDLEPFLMRNYAVRAQIHAARKTVDQINILLSWLDAQPGNAALISAFQGAVYTHSGIEWALNARLIARLGK
ncbi:hypothetical protein MIND_00795000 [Mycena indigotica]|uniref:Uncharacterized protein n=1 Tax=Mycena indigotica TaxID=2126181 RepID=A0A8H6SMC6_9AGAR|nr:uncharacterized protein MIND_00795000 [Mycena indigotica]KAF7302278.1 hypothetical protein MIND_00795000 [Mycena indigotica]